jgi:shikimate kinase
MKFKEYLTEGVYDPAIFKAIFLCGGAGSGKSYVASKTTLGHGLKLVNSDVMFEKMLKDVGLKTTPEDIFSDKGQEIRGRAKKSIKTLQKNYVEGRLGLVIDGTGKDFDKIKGQSEELKALGYDTKMIFVNTSLDVAQERNAKRSRKLDPVEVEKM